MKKQIEKIILETLVIENKQSIHHAVDKIDNLIKQQAVGLFKKLEQSNELLREANIYLQDSPFTRADELQNEIENFIQEQSKPK